MSAPIQPIGTVPKTGDLGNEWADRWRAGRTGFHQPDINAQLVQHWPKLVPNEKASVVVPLCGKSRDMRWLHRRGHRVVGVEIVELACQAFFEEQGLCYERTQQTNFLRFEGRGEAAGLTLLCGDLFALRAEDIGPVHAWYDRAAIVALPHALWSRYAAWVASVLPADGAGFMLTFEYPQAERQGPPFSVGISDVEAHFAADFELKQLEQLDLTADNHFNLSRVHKHAVSLKRR
jgi:thiopurine S-methyltransferase